MPGRRDGRLPAAGRWLAGLTAGLALAVNTVVLLSDRAPGLLRRLSDRLDVDTLAVTAAQAAPGSDVPRSDFLIHVVLWTLATVLVGLAMGPTWSKVVAAGLVLAYSGGLESAQGVLTSSRSPQPADMLGNAVGVTSGLAVAVGVGFVRWCRPAGRR